MATPISAGVPWKTKSKDLRHDLDLTTDELVHLLELTHHLKKKPAHYAQALAGRYLSLLFEKPSLRTRLTFELAIKQLGGDSILNVGPIGEREPIKDVARNLDRWTNGIVARTFLQQTVDDLAKWSSVPVINALSDLYHPCQALADFVTLKEHFGKLKGIKLAFVGDGNNVAHSLMLTAARTGTHFALAHPVGYEPDEAIVNTTMDLAQATGAKIMITTDPEEAVHSSNAVYTDVWASMGQENEAAERQRIFKPYQVNQELFEKAKQDAVFMHCLPAKRNQETTDEVMELPRSVVFDQAENRLHAQKALLLMLLQ